MTSILGISGSLRAGSHNRQLLVALGSHFPPSVEFTIFDGTDIPVFNVDVEAAGEPAAVVALRQAISEADLVVFATPEYNGGIPGSLKNMIDWASRADDPLSGRPVAIIGGSGGRFATSHAQLMLRHILGYMGCPIMPRPMVAFGGIAKSFEGDALVDESIRHRLEAAAGAMVEWVERVG